jgi:hypothetical protein
MVLIVMNNKKILAVVAFIMSIVALAGSLFVITILLEVGSALNGLEATPEGSLVAPMMSIFSGFLMFGWIWSICVLITAVYAIYASYRTLREK